MTRDPEPIEDDPPRPDERAAWLAALREALVRASALVDEARAAGRDTSEAEERIAVALALLDRVEAGIDGRPAAERGAR